MYRDSMTAQRGLQHEEVHLIVVVVAKDGASIVAALTDVQADPRNEESSSIRHGSGDQSKIRSHPRPSKFPRFSHVVSQLRQAMRTRDFAALRIVKPMGSDPPLTLSR